MLLLALACSSSDDAPKRVEVFIVRHAEKDTSVEEDPPLTPEGEARAQALAKQLAHVPLVGVHSTDTLRTRSTGAPTARAHDLPLQTYDPKQPDDLVTLLKSQPGAHLVVGHSNTVPDLVGRFGGKQGTAINEKYEFDRLYSIVIQGEEAPVTVMRRYGKPNLIPLTKPAGPLIPTNGKLVPTPVEALPAPAPEAPPAP